MPDPAARTMNSNSLKDSRMRLARSAFVAMATLCGLSLGFFSPSAASAAGPDAGAPRADAGPVKTSDAGAPRGDAGPSPNDAGVVPAGPLTMPPDDDAEDPHGMGQDPHAGGAPHGAHAGAGGDGTGMFEPPPDTSEPDANLPPGTLRIHVLDADNKPLPGQVVTIGIVNNSVAKGESRRKIECQTDQDGVCNLKDQDRGQLLAYRATVLKDGATFAAPPFQLPADKGVRCNLHVYPVVHDQSQTLIVSQAIVYVEMKDDRVQIQEAVSIYNFGKAAWVPNDLVLDLPPEFTALTAGQEMSDVVVDSVAKKGARIRGTFGPGRHDVELRWQVPYTGTRDVSIAAGMPPHLAAGRVMAPASAQMKLVVDGFPQAEARTDNQGQRLLVTERELKREEAPMTRIKIEIRDLPTVGPARWIASALTAIVLLGAVGFGFVAQGPAKKGSDGEGKKNLLEELEDLERAHRAGDVGPKTYERTRRTLLERLARLLRDETKDAPAAKKKA